MNILNLRAGGHPLFTQDMNHIQNAWRQGFEALASQYISDGVTAVILSGCEVTNNNGTLDISEGFIYYDGEIWKVNAGVNLPDVLLLGLKFTVSYDNPSVYIYANAASHGVLEVRELNFAVGTGQIDFAWVNALTIGQAIVVQSGNANYFGSSLLNGTTSGTFAPYYRKDKFNRVTFSGQIVVPAGSFNSTSSTPLLSLCVIPDSIQPIDPQNYNVGSIEGKTITLTITTNQMYLSYPVGFSSDFLLNLSVIRYSTRK